MKARAGRAKRAWAWPLVPVYAAGLAVKDGLRAAGVLRTRRLAWPVVSVGSLSAGGAGKTPVVIALAGLLQSRGWGVDVLSRGYGREGRGVERVIVTGEKQVLRFAQDDNVLSKHGNALGEFGNDGEAAGRFGDEPVLIARRAGVEVWVGADRYAAGFGAEGEGDPSDGRDARIKRGPQRLKPQIQTSDYGTAEAVPLSKTDLLQDEWHLLRENGPSPVMRDSIRRVHLLDDGFQHRGLGRAVDVVLVTEDDLEDALLPAGNRREGLRALRRADVVVVREEERGRIEERVRTLMRADAKVWSVRRELRFAVGGGVGKGESQRTQRKGESTEGGVAGLRLVAFCAIARPGGFFSMLAAAGCEVVGKMAFGDHHRYTRGDVEQLVKVCDECGAEGFVTTEKDAVKLTVEMRARLEAVGPVCVARLDVVFVDEAVVVMDLEGRIG